MINFKNIKSGDLIKIQNNVIVMVIKLIYIDENTEYGQYGYMSVLRNEKIINYFICCNNIVKIKTKKWLNLLI